ncbi:MAG: hypothetical protein ACSLE0_19745, partial [Chitinophagaceae bacterium]
MKLIGLLFLLCVYIGIDAQINTNPVVKRLTQVIDSYPMLSKEGRLVFQSNRTGSWEIFTSNEDGSNIKQLTHNDVEDLIPCWSPDGTKIVFASGMDNTSDIFIMNGDGTERKQLTTTFGDDSHPHFSADGNFIIFNSARSSPDLNADWSKQWHEIFIMNSDGSKQRQITSFKGVSTFPDLSPDGKQIVFRRVTGEAGFNWDLSTSKRNSEIFLMDIDAGNLTNISNNASFDGWPRWSPDGKQIVFASNRSGPANTGQLFMYDKENKKTTQISFGAAGHVQPSFSPDGKKIVDYEVYETSEYEFGGILS